jgi:tRNA pseudouridine55 synthase
MNGLLVIDKPGGVTSRDAVNRAQRWLPKGTKVGHTGTLDPLATGVLVLCVGAATRLADLIQGMGKTYRSRFRLGARSDTDDADGAVTPMPGAAPPGEAALRDALAAFVGEIEQVPPAYSAVKLGGRRAHDLARGGEAVSLAPRRVRVDAIRLLGYAWPFADVEIDCGKGTYIRAIARDLGAALGCGGLVETLRRTRVGPFTAEQGAGLDVPPEEGRAKLLPMTMAVQQLPRVELDTDRARKFAHGQLFNAVDVLPAASIYTQFAVMEPTGRLIGIGIRHEGGSLRPVIVFGNGG